MLDVKQKAAVVVTSINPPTNGVIKIAAMCEARGWPFIVVGDKKSPIEYSITGLNFLSVDKQEALNFETVKTLPYNTYSRKMLGYLVAACDSIDYIVETDDDNIPYENFLELPKSETTARTDPSVQGWINCYSYFTTDEIWPRGFPLNKVRASKTAPHKEIPAEIKGGKYIQQALADGDPDVDAVFRLVVQNDVAIKFQELQPLLIQSNQISPFNSQATTWPIELLELMYLPTTCSFRMTDIWRSFICQKILKNIDYDLVVIGPRLEQIRNVHDLMKDFTDEIEGYVGYDKFLSILETVPITGKMESIGLDLNLIYRELSSADFFEVDELKYLESWLQDVQKVKLLRGKL